MAQKFTVPITVKQLTSAGSDAITVYVDADTYARLKIEAGGRLTWGPGNGAGDVNLYRDGADVLRTDDTFKTPILFVDNIEIDPTGAQTDYVLKYDGTKFTAASASFGGGGGATSLDGLTDVVITAPEEFQSLSYNGTNWVNGHIPVVSYVRNAESTTLTTGTVVYLFGATGDHATVKRADKASDTTSSKTVGLVGANIAASQNGPVVTRGYVDGIDLSVGYSPGDVLWLGSNGAFTKTKATAPDHLVFVGVVVRATNNGIVYVATQNGYELDELHNVAASSPSPGDFLKYNGSLWVNEPIDLGTDTVGNYVSDVTAGTGVTVTHTPGEGSSPTIAIGQSVATNANPTFAGATLDNIQVGITTANTIDTSTGNLTIDSAGGTTTISDNLVVSGDLTVSGTTTTVNTATLNIADNVVTLNSDFTTGSPTENAGVEVLRGSSPTVALRWNETNDKWEVTNDGTTYGNVINTADTGTVTSTMIADGTIVNADVSTSAAIAHSKLANATAGQVLLGTTTTGVITATSLSGDVTVTGAGVTAIGSGVIVNADINASAAIAHSKLASLTSGNILVGSATNVPTSVAVTGDVTISNAGVTAIGSGVIVDADINSAAAVSLSKLASGTAGQVVVANATGVPTYTTISGDVTINSSGVATIAADSVALGTDTTGNYVQSLVAGTGITLTNATASEGGTPTIAVTANTYQPLDADLTAIAGLTGTSGLLKKTAADTWALDTATYVSTADTGTVTSTMIADGTIVNADVNASAAIAHSKLANATPGQVLLGTTTTGVVTATTVSGDVTITGAGVTAIGSGVIVDADINASAAVAHSKLANITAGSVLMGNATNVPTATALSGDVTINSSGVTAIGSGVIVNADINASAAIDKTKISGTAITAADTGTVTSTMIADGTIVNADINTSAAIAHSKLANASAGQVLLGTTTTGVVTATTLSGDVTIDGGGVTAIASGAIVNADINASAAIAHSKLANATAGQVLLGTTTTGVVTATTVSGDVTITGAGVTAIGSGVIVDADVNASAAIALSKLASGTAGQVVLGNATGVPTYTSLSGDVTVNSSGVTAIGSGVIVDADINSAAAIGLSKLSTTGASSGYVISYNGTSWAASQLSNNSYNLDGGTASSTYGGITSLNGGTA